MMNKGHTYTENELGKKIQETEKEIISSFYIDKIPDYVGYYQIGSNLQISSTTKPKWLHRKMMNIFLGIKWFDFEKKQL